MLLRLTRSHLSLFLLFSLGALLHAAADGSLQGTISDDSGTPVARAVLTLHQLAGSATLETNSDAKGHYRLSNIAPGSYLLNVSGSDQALAFSGQIDIAGGQQRVSDIRLVLKPVSTQVTVTAAAEPQSLDQVSKALDVVSTSDAEKRGIISAAEALNFVPGVRVSTRGGPGAFTTIQTRGLPTENTAILVDGLPFRDPTSVKDEASAYTGNLYLVDSSRIEVLRGSGSSLYGTNAAAGTINLITNTGGGPLRGDLDLQGGGLGLFRGLAQIAGGAGENRLLYSAGLARLNVNQGVADSGAARDWSGQFGLQYSLTPNIRVAADVLLEKGYLQLATDPFSTPAAPVTGVVDAVPLAASQVKLAQTNQPFEVGAATFVPSLSDPDSGRYSHFTDSVFRLDQDITSRLSYRLVYGLVDTERNNTNGPAGPNGIQNFDLQVYQPLFNSSDRFSGRVDTVQARVNYLLGSRQILTAGYEFTREHYLELATDQNPDPALRRDDRTEAQQRWNSVDAQDELRLLGGRLNVLLSGRFTGASLDQPSFRGGSSPYSQYKLTPPPNAYTGDGSVSYFLSGTATKIRAHVGNSFRMPSLYERFGGYFYGGSFYPLGDPRLGPERSISVDGGFDQYLFHERLKVSATYFYTHLQQVVGYLGFPPDYVDPYGRFGGYRNTGGGVDRGVELSGEFRPTSKTLVTTSYTYTNAQDRRSQFYTGSGIDPLQTPGIIAHSVKVVAMQDLGRRFDVAMDFNGGSSYLFPLFGANFSASTAFRFQGPRQLGLAAGYTLPATEHVTTRFYVRVSNALDQNFTEDGFQTPGRWAVGGVRLRF